MKNPLLFIIFTVLAAVAASFVTLKWSGAPGEKATAARAESVYDRVMRTQVIRAGYVSNPPSCMKDPNTGKYSGIFVEAMQEAVKKLGLRIEWTEEAGWGTMIEGMESGRYDIVPCAIWPNSRRSTHVDFTKPLFYSGIAAYVRADDNRFDKNITLINSPSVKIATMDGEMAEVIASTDFPLAQKVQVPQLSEISNMLLNVKDRKADVTFVELYFAHEFLKNNPGALKNITADKPLRVFPDTVMIPGNEFALRQMLDTAFEELLNTGYVDSLLDKYEPAPGTFYRLAPPFHIGFAGSGDKSGHTM
ncbi:MAG: transporter substrate-binding domain-containing protein [Alphaproteobacteria bacterium]|nr:transporter substrate-binding domain-containing protein [Alphaproteobacteria bacterium]